MLRFLLASIDLLTFGLESAEECSPSVGDNGFCSHCSMGLQGCDVQDKSITDQ
jgi:hypothetical protein